MVLAFAIQHHPDVAKAWFLSPTTSGSSTLYAEAASVLDSDAKLQLVRAMPASTGPRAFVALVGRDATLYKEFLSRRDLEPMHLEPLADRVPSPALAITALDHGYSPNDIAERIATWAECHPVWVDFPEFRTVEKMRGEEWFPEPPDVARHDALAEWERHSNPAVRQICCLIMEMERR